MDSIDMDLSQRLVKFVFKLLLAILMISMHYLLVPVPVVEGFLAYIILFNPTWFRDFLERLS